MHGLQLMQIVNVYLLGPRLNSPHNSSCRINQLGELDDVGGGLAEPEVMLSSSIIKCPLSAVIPKIFYVIGSVRLFKNNRREASSSS